MRIPSDDPLITSVIRARDDLKSKELRFLGATIASCVSEGASGSFWVNIRSSENSYSTAEFYASLENTPHWWRRRARRIANEKSQIACYLDLCETVKELSNTESEIFQQQNRLESSSSTKMKPDISGDLEEVGPPFTKPKERHHQFPKIRLVFQSIKGWFKDMWRSVRQWLRVGAMKSDSEKVKAWISKQKNQSF